MSYKELNKLSHEDLSVFEKRLTAFFESSVADGYTMLRKHLETRFPPSRFSNSEDLIDACITRLTLKVVELELRGEPVIDLTAFASKVAKFITLEDGRQMIKHDEIDREVSSETGTSFQRELRYAPDHEIGAIEREIRLNCMTACLEELSQEKQLLLLSYYPSASLTPQEKKEMRLKLAHTEAGTTLAGASERSDRPMKNLHTKVSKVRTKLGKCLEKCLEKNTSSNLKLIFLKTQDARS